MNSPEHLPSSTQRLLAALTTHYSPAQHLVAGKRGEALRQRGVDNVLREAARVRQELKPGLIRRALLARSLQRELLTAGYDGQFVRSLLAAVLAELTRSITPPPQRS